MSQVTAKIFRNGRSQAIRIPAAFRFDTDRVILEKDGDALVVRPYSSGGWAEFFADESLRVDEELDLERDIPPQERDLF